MTKPAVLVTFQVPEASLKRLREQCEISYLSPVEDLKRSRRPYWVLTVFS